jgi:hypothetical protein
MLKEARVVPALIEIEAVNDMASKIAVKKLKGKI